LDPKASDTTSAAGLNQVADELDRLAPEEFTAARTVQEKQARQAGDRELAARIHRLAKPTVAAWLANQLARATDHPVSDATAQGLEDTLYAALADEHAADQPLAGRLIDPLERSGFGDWPATGVRAPLQETPAPTSPRQPRRDRRAGAE